MSRITSELLNERVQDFARDPEGGSGFDQIISRFLTPGAIGAVVVGVGIIIALLLLLLVLNTRTHQSDCEDEDSPQQQQLESTGTAMNEVFVSEYCLSDQMISMDGTKERRDLPLFEEGNATEPTNNGSE
jgi:hypothetical protein